MKTYAIPKSFLIALRSDVSDAPDRALLLGNQTEKSFIFEGCVMDI